MHIVIVGKMDNSKKQINVDIDVIIFYIFDLFKIYKRMQMVINHRNIIIVIRIGFYAISANNVDLSLFNYVIGVMNSKRTNVSLKMIDRS